MLLIGASGKDTPQEIKKVFGRPRRKYVDFLLLIGARKAQSLRTWTFESPKPRIVAKSQDSFHKLSILIYKKFA
jgi:hypothetical protein